MKTYLYIIKDETDITMHETLDMADAYSYLGLFGHDGWYLVQQDSDGDETILTTIVNGEGTTA